MIELCEDTELPLKDWEKIEDDLVSVARAENFELSINFGISVVKNTEVFVVFNEFGGTWGYFKSIADCDKAINYWCEKELEKYDGLEDYETRIEENWYFQARSDGLY